MNVTVAFVALVALVIAAVSCDPNPDTSLRTGLVRVRLAAVAHHVLASVLTAQPTHRPRGHG